MILLSISIFMIDVILVGTASLLAFSVSTVIDQINVNETSAASQNVAMNSSMPHFVVSSTFNQTTKRGLLTVTTSISYGGEMPIGPISTKAMELALDRLRLDPNWLPGYELVFELVDDKCIDAVEINEIVPRLLNDDKAQIPLILGLGCAAKAQTTLGEVMKYFNHIHVDVIQLAPELFTNRKRYSSYFGMGDQGDFTWIALVEFMKQMGWAKFAILSDRFAYYDMVEQAFLPRIVSYNMTLLWIGKVSHAVVDEKEMRNSLDEMSIHQPRIIIVHSDLAAGRACWLHRYGMFGPGFVTFFFYWTDIYPSPKVPDNLESWCTLNMIYEVLESSFILGDSSIPDTYGRNIRDSTGMNGYEYDAAMEAKLENAKNYPHWEYWRTPAYDLALFAGFVLNTTENSLNTRNETLSDWVTSSGKFKQNGTLMANLLKQSIYSTHMRGFKGEYYFEENTTFNSKGFTPASFTQVRINSIGKLEKTVVGVFISNLAKPLYIYSNRIKWRTQDGRPPKDSLIAAYKQEQVISNVAIGFTFFLGFTIQLSLFALLNWKIRRFVVKITKKPSFSSINKLHIDEKIILVGNMLMLSQIYATPRGLEDNNNISRHCTAFILLFIGGYSISIFGLTMKLEHLVRTFRKQSSTSRYLRLPFIGLSAALWFPPNIAVVTAYLVAFPITQVHSLTSTEISREDPSLQLQYYHYTCHFTFSTAGSATLFAVLVCIHTVLLVRVALLTYQLRLLKNSTTSEMKFVSTCLYYILQVFVGGAVISVLLVNQVFIVAAFTTMAFTLITTMSAILSKFIEKKPTERSYNGVFRFVYEHRNLQFGKKF